MVKKIEYYECEICNQRWTSLKEAEECEAKGRPESRPDLVGVIFGDNRPGKFYEHIVFALPEKYGDKESLPVTYGHYLLSCLWACRDNKAGDSIGDQYCGGNNLTYKEVEDSHVDTSMPAFKRMVEFLRSRGLTPKLAMPDGTIKTIEGD